MYLPLVLLGLVYGLRFILRIGFAQHLRFRQIVIFLLAMYALVGLMGSITGYMRWHGLQTRGTLVMGEIIFSGRCDEWSAYEEGRHMRMMKRIEVVQASRYSRDYQPFTTSTDAINSIACVGYRFRLDNNDVVYARENGNRAALEQSVAIRYDPSYLNNNWIDAFIPDTMAVSVHYMWVFGGVLIETLIAALLMLWKDRRDRARRPF